MNTEHTYTYPLWPTPLLPDEVWDVFLPNDDLEPIPEEGDCWIESEDDWNAA